MADSSKLHYEPGWVIIDTPDGPINMTDPVLTGNLSALLAAFAFAALIGLLASQASRSGPPKTGPGAIGAPATLLLVAVLSLFFATFQAHLTAASAGRADDPVPFAINYLVMGNLASVGFAVVFLAVTWLFITVDVFMPYSRAARFIYQALFLVAVWQWLGFTAFHVRSITGTKLLPSSGPSSVTIIAAAIAALFASGYFARFLLRRLRRKDLIDTQLAFIPALAITGACVVVYLAAGFGVLWRIFSKPVFQVSLMRELEPITLWLLMCLPVYLVLLMCQFAVPAIPRKSSALPGQ